MPAQKGSTSRPDKGSAGPSQKSKKRPRDGGNVATTTRSTGSLPTPPPRQEAIEMGEPSLRCMVNVVGLPEAGARASPSPLDLLGGGLKFTLRVRVALPRETRESIRGVSPSDLLRSGLELMCRSIVLRLVAEAAEDLKQSFAANSELSSKIA